uniref:Uncharacterized protein n=1 Tax=Myoviridae sp. ctCL221 TaxID=2826630 RepID=A0A8S5M638_9CAUD|nr:MAG TPA: hypothetical protein [Myoviridae sp. ctCL221]
MLISLIVPCSLHFEKLPLHFFIFCAIIYLVMFN